MATNGQLAESAAAAERAHAAWKRAIADHARRQAAHRTSRKPKPLKPGMIQIPPPEATARSGDDRRSRPVPPA